MPAFEENTPQSYGRGWRSRTVSSSASWDEAEIEASLNHLSSPPATVPSNGSLQARRTCLAVPGAHARRSASTATMSSVDGRASQRGGRSRATSRTLSEDAASSSSVPTPVARSIAKCKESAFPRDSGYGASDHAPSSAMKRARLSPTPTGDVSRLHLGTRSRTISKASTSVRARSRSDPDEMQGGGGVMEEEAEDEDQANEGMGGFDDDAEYDQDEDQAGEDGRYSLPPPSHCPSKHPAEPKRKVIDSDDDEDDDLHQSHHYQHQQRRPTSRSLSRSTAPSSRSLSTPFGTPRFATTSTPTTPQNGKVHDPICIVDDEGEEDAYRAAAAFDDFAHVWPMDYEFKDVSMLCVNYPIPSWFEMDKAYDSSGRTVPLPWADASKTSSSRTHLYLRFQWDDGLNGISRRTYLVHRKLALKPIIDDVYRFIGHIKDPTWETAEAEYKRYVWEGQQVRPEDRLQDLEFVNGGMIETFQQQIGGG